MNLLQMSLSGAILILVTMITRTLLINRLPKKTFLVLWEIVILRLLLPISIPSIFSIYSFINQNAPVYNTFTEIPATNFIPTNINVRINTQEIIQNDISIWFIIWSIGTLLCISFFIIVYLHCRSEFQASLPVKNDFINDWLNTHHLKRPITIRQSNKIFAPLTYGIFKPIILMPQNTDWEDKQKLKYILLHEYIHICHYDMIKKLILVLAVCIHWFNPMVWIMYILFNRDIELVCDECVVNESGQNSKSDYALTLISMEENKNSLVPFSNSFSKNAIKERIISIMKIKRSSLFTIITAILLIAFVTTAFATSAITKTNKLSPIPNTSFSNEEYTKLIALQYDGYEKMSISEYREKVLNETDTKEYMELLERFYQDNTLFDMRDINETADFLFYTLTPLRAEKWQTRSFSGYAITDFPQASDQASIEYQFTLTIIDANNLTVGEYNTARKNMQKDWQSFFNDKTVEELQNQQEILKDIREELELRIKKYGNKNLQISINNYFYSPLTIYDTPNSSSDEIERRKYPNGTKEDYSSLLALKTENYKQMSISDFNSILLDWANNNFDSLERIQTDVSWNDYQVDLSEDELSFVVLTIGLSNTENSERIRSLNTGIPEKNPWVSNFNLEKRGKLVWCRLYYQFPYHISNKEKLTVGERDYRVGSVVDGIQTFWDETSLDDLLNMTEDDIILYMQELASKYSNDLITISIAKDQVQFEKMDERKYQ